MTGAGRRKDYYTRYRACFLKTGRRGCTGEREKCIRNEEYT